MVVHFITSVFIRQHLLQDALFTLTQYRLSYAFSTSLCQTSPNRCTKQGSNVVSVHVSFPSQVFIVDDVTGYN